LGSNQGQTVEVGLSSFEKSLQNVEHKFLFEEVKAASRAPTD